MLETIIVILLILWLVGFLGWGRRRGRVRGGGRWAEGNLIHVVLVIVVILLLLRLFGVI